MYNGVEYTTLSCNNLEFEDNSGKSKAALDYSDNSKYFNSADDYGIFKYVNTDDENNFSIIGNSIQRNRNDSVNTYFAKIKFLDNYYFKNDKYMIYSSGMLSEFRDSATDDINPSANTVIYCDKSRSAVTALLVTFPADHEYRKPGYDAKHGGIVINSYHCKIIGELDRQ